MEGGDTCRLTQVLPLAALADARKLARCQNEIDCSQALHHPRVATFLGSFQDEQFVYLLQELCCERMPRPRGTAEMLADCGFWP
jgi:hypothetical protein